MAPRLGAVAFGLFSLAEAARNPFMLHRSIRDVLPTGESGAAWAVRKLRCDPAFITRGLSSAYFADPGCSLPITGVQRTACAASNPFASCFWEIGQVSACSSASV